MNTRSVFLKKSVSRKRRNPFIFNEVTRSLKCKDLETGKNIWTPQSAVFVNFKTLQKKTPTAKFQNSVKIAGNYIFKSIQNGIAALEKNDLKSVCAQISKKLQHKRFLPILKQERKTEGIKFVILWN